MKSELLTKPMKTRKRVDERLTFKEFCNLINEDQKAHLIDGVMVMESPASYTHEDIFGFLYSILRIYVSKKN